MEKISVLDACAVIAYLRGEMGMDIVEAHLLDENRTCIIHAVNLCEVYYDFLRGGGQTAADTAIEDVVKNGVVISRNMSDAFIKRVGQFKVAYRVSLADCFALSLAVEMGGDLLTSDHHEFDALLSQSIFSILFIR